MRAKTNLFLILPSAAIFSDAVRKIALSERQKHNLFFDFAERSYLPGRSPKNSVKREAKTKVM
ncbi:MAG: hypothetical protein PHT87_05035, partial [Bacteroidales bacterium]|nr:hypothetical protein [Bacteroidales bacterium]